MQWCLHFTFETAFLSLPCRLRLYFLHTISCTPDLYVSSNRNHRDLGKHFWTRIPCGLKSISKNKYVQGYRYLPPIQVAIRRILNTDCHGDPRQWSKCRKCPAFISGVSLAPDTLQSIPDSVVTTNYTKNIIPQDGSVTAVCDGYNCRQDVNKLQTNPSSV